MVQIPTKEQLGRARDPEVQGIVRLADDPRFRALQDVARGVGDVSSALQKRSNQIKEDRAKAQDFEARKRFMDFEQEQRNAFADAQRNAPEDGAGFADTFKQQYTAAAKSFYKALPAEGLDERQTQALKQFYDLRLGELDNELFSEALDFETNASDKYIRDSLTRAKESSRVSLSLNPDSLPRIQRELGNLISGSNLGETEKATLRRNLGPELATDAIRGLTAQGRFEEARSMLREYMRASSGQGELIEETTGDDTPRIAGDREIIIGPEWVRARIEEIEKAETDVSDKLSASTSDSIKLKITSDPYSISEGQIMSMTGLDDGDKSTLIRDLRKQRKQGEDERLALAMYRLTPGDFNNQDEKHRKGVDLIYKRMISDAESVEDRFRIAQRITAKTGIVPPSVTTSIKGGLASSNIEEFVQSATFASVLYESSDKAFNAPGAKSVRDAAVEYAYMTKQLGLSPERAASSMMDVRDPGKKKERTILDASAKEVVDDLKTNDITSQFETIWEDYTPFAALGTGAELDTALLESDYRELMRINYVAVNGNVELAKARTNEDMKRLYGRSQFMNTDLTSSDDSLVLNPIENYYEKINDSYDWIVDQMRDNASAYLGDDLDGDPFLIPDALTRQDIANGAPPRYRLGFKTTEVVDGNEVTIVEMMPDGNYFQPDYDRAKTDFDRREFEKARYIEMPLDGNIVVVDRGSREIVTRDEFGGYTSTGKKYETSGKSGTPRYELLLDPEYKDIAGVPLMKALRAGALARIRSAKVAGDDVDFDPTFPAPGYIEIKPDGVSQIEQLRAGSLVPDDPDEAAPEPETTVVERPKDTKSDTFIDKVVKAESGGDPDARAATSSALGAGQFVDETWLSMVGAYRPDLQEEYSRDELLELRRNENLSREMIGYLAEENSKILRDAGEEATQRNLYLAHLLGPSSESGALKLLKSHNSDKLDDVLPERVVNANAWMKGKTVGWLKAFADDKLNGVL